MKKIIALSVLTVLLSSSAYAGHRDNGEIKERHHHIVNRHHVVHIRPNHIRPHRHHVITHVRRPHYVSLHHRVGHRIHRLHPNAFRLSVGGIGYHYSSGAFYRPYRRGYRVVRAPIGAIIMTLPIGYSTVYLNNRNYYRYEDTYYERRGRGYCVVEAPVEYVQAPTTNCNRVNNINNYHYQVGDIALNLPAGAIEVIIDGKRYYEAEGQYFLRTYRDGRNVYEVVEI